VAPRKRPATKSTSRPDALALLKADHRDVETLFSRFESLGERAHKTRADVVGKLITALSIHAAIEEQLFYPAVRATVPDLEDMILEGLEEHHLVKWTLSELERMSPQDERYSAKVTVLIENVRHHVKEEEREMFPQVRKAMSRSDLDDLGVQLAEAKRTAPTRPHPHAPDTPPANVVAATLTRPLDAAINVVESATERVRDLVT
jgi:hemerythrin superfamily protein